MQDENVEEKIKGKLVRRAHAAEQRVRELSLEVCMVLKTHSWFFTQ
jgi:hypothetical protein